MTLWQILVFPFRRLVGSLRNRSQSTSQATSERLSDAGGSSRAILNGRLIRRLEIKTHGVITINDKFSMPNGTTFYVKEPSLEFYVQAVSLAKKGYISGRYWLEGKSTWQRDGF